MLILNDPRTGYPLACIEASLISATRTAASAPVATEHISPKPFRGILGVIGTEVIARTTVQWLLFRNWKLPKISLCDVDRKKAEHFGKWLRDQHNLQVNAGGLEVTVEAGVTDKQLNKHLRDQAFSYRLILGPMPPSAAWLRRAVVASGSWKARTNSTVSWCSSSPLSSRASPATPRPNTTAPLAFRRNGAGEVETHHGRRRRPQPLIGGAASH